MTDVLDGPASRVGGTDWVEEWFASDYGTLKRWLRTFTPDAEDIASEIALRFVQREQEPDNAAALARVMGKGIWKNRCKLAEREGRRVKDAYGLMQPGETLLIDASRCLRREWTAGKVEGYGRGNKRLPMVPCPVCGVLYKHETVHSKGKSERQRKATCGARSCSRKLYWRKRKGLT